MASAERESRTAGLGPCARLRLLESAKKNAPVLQANHRTVRGTYVQKWHMNSATKFSIFCFGQVWGYTVHRELINWAYGIFMLKSGYSVYHFLTTNFECIVFLRPFRFLVYVLGTFLGTIFWVNWYSCLEAACLSLCHFLNAWKRLYQSTKWKYIRNFIQSFSLDNSIMVCTVSKSKSTKRLAMTRAMCTGARSAHSVIVMNFALISRR